MVKVMVSSNRTFMELKLAYVSKLYTEPIVLIAPLWNWNNYLKRLQPHRFRCSNRTFMELKSRKMFDLYLEVGVLIAPLWNWNECDGEQYRAERSSNRTFMELKS